MVNEFEGEERNKIMAIFSSCVVLGPIIGPILGGVIAENSSWRWIFYVNVPICLIGFFIVYFLMHEKETDDQKPKATVKADYLSFFYMAIGIGCLEYFIDEGNQKNWFESHELIIILTIALIFIGFFIWRGLAYPKKSVVNFKIFKYRNYVVCCFAVWLFLIIIVAAFAFFPTLLQQGYGFPVDRAGIITAPRGVASFIAAPIFMQLNRKVDGRILMLIGLAIFAISSYLLINYSVNYNNELIIITVIIQGIGMMGVFIQLMQLSYVNMPPEYNSDASGVFNFFRNIGNSVGTSIASTIISRQQQISWHDLSGHLSLHKSSNYSLWLSHAPYHSHLIPILSSNVQAQAFFISNIDVFYLSLIAIIFIAWVPFALEKSTSSISNFHID
jgi:DHA2 family multidrug resistance protein